jgi:hypothetical protein
LRATRPGAPPEERYVPATWGADGVERYCSRAAALDYVVALRAVRYVAPTVDEELEHFTPGALTLEGFIIRPTSGEIAGQFVVSSSMDETVDYEGHRDYSERTQAQRALREDLERNARRAIREALRPLSVGMGPPEPETAATP